MKKKFLYILTALVAALSLMMFAACASDPAPEPKPTPDNPPVTEKEITVTMDPSLNMSLFENACVTAVTNSEEAVKYSSLDTSVLTVDENTGIITPLKAGTATVTASVENKTATCSVTVAAPDANGFTFLAVNRAVTLKKAQNTALEIKAFMGDKRLSGISLSFESDKTNIVTVSDAGVLTAVSKGSATVTVSGTYRGVSLGTDTIEIDVIQNVTVSISASETTLYTRAGEDNLPTQADLTIVTNVDGEDVTVQPDEYTITSSDEAVVKCESGKLVAKGKKGEATVRVDYTTPEGTAAHNTLNITAVYPTQRITVTDSVIAGINRGLIYTPENFNAVTAGTAYIGNDEYSVTIGNNGDIKVDLFGADASETAVSVKIYADSADTTYEILITATVYDFLIGDKAEFTAFANALNTADYVYARLTSNVDMENAAISVAANSASATGNTVSFMLDGDGFGVIDSAAGSNYGAFAANVGKNSAGKNTVVKNIAFSKFDAKNNNAAGLFYQISNTEFENFYLSTSVNFFNGGMIAVREMENVTYNNCVAYCYEAADPNRTETANFCKIGGLTSEGIPHTEKNYTNTFAVNPVASKMILGSVHTILNHQPWETEDKEYEVDDGVTTFTDGLYASWEEFAEEHSALPQGFDSQIWMINDFGELTFKTLTTVFDNSPIVEGAQFEKIFKAVTPASNTATWIESENRFKLTQAVAQQDDTRGFYIDFDYMRSILKRGATQISFTVKTSGPNNTNGDKYFSFATDANGTGWWGNRNLGVTVSFATWQQDVIIDISKAPKNSTLWILFANQGDFYLENIRIQKAETTPFAITSENISFSEVGITSNKGHTNASISASGPNGEEGNYIKFSNGGYSGVKIDFTTPIDVTDGMAMTVKVYIKSATEIRFYKYTATGDWQAVSEIYYNFPGNEVGTWKEFTLNLNNYKDTDGKFHGFQFAAHAGAEIYIGEMNIISVTAV